MFKGGPTGPFTFDATINEGTGIYQFDVPLFYKNALGLEIDWNGEDPYAIFLHEGIHFSMSRREDLPGLLGQTPEFPRRLNGTFQLAINVGRPENVDITFKEVLSRGGREIYPPRDEPWDMRSAMICDPEGNIIEIASSVPLPDTTTRP